MSAPCQDICSAWATTADLPGDPNAKGINPAVMDDALLIASTILYNLTLQQWPGWCSDIVRPTSRYASPDTMNASRFNVPWSCSCRGRDQYQPGCTALSQITLGEGPITSIVEVKIDGEVVPPERYRVDDYRWLVYQPDPDDASGRRGWPCCQRMDLPDDAVGTFSVHYTVGTPPGRGGVRSAASLAWQLALLWTPELASECIITGKVTSMSRQQVTMTVNDPSAMFDKGGVGLSDVDLWISSVLRGHSTRRAAVVIPERARQKVRRRTS